MLKGLGPKAVRGDWLPVKTGRGPLECVVMGAGSASRTSTPCTTCFLVEGRGLLVVSDQSGPIRSGLAGACSTGALASTFRPLGGPANGSLTALRERPCTSSPSKASRSPQGDDRPAPDGRLVPQTLSTHQAVGWPRAPEGSYGAFPAQGVAVARRHCTLGGAAAYAGRLFGATNSPSASRPPPPPRGRVCKDRSPALTSVAGLVARSAASPLRPATIARSPSAPSCAVSHRPGYVLRLGGTPSGQSVERAPRPRGTESFRARGLTVS